MNERFSRTANLIGADSVERLSRACVAVFGIGGVGSFTAEAPARAGAGYLIFIDADVVDITNINRQLIAATSTVGRPKVEVMRERVLDINPAAKVETHQIFYTPETASQIDLSGVDYIVDAIDTVTAKLYLVEQAVEKNIKIISAMGAGNKLDPTRFEVADIYKTSVCPLAKVMRTELRKRKVPRLKVVYSKEEPVVNFNSKTPRTPASISFVPSVMGLILASEVIKDLSL